MSRRNDRPHREGALTTRSNDRRRVSTSGVRVSRPISRISPGVERGAQLVSRRQTWMLCVWLAKSTPGARLDSRRQTWMLCVWLAYKIRAKTSYSTGMDRCLITCKINEIILVHMSCIVVMYFSRSTAAPNRWRHVYIARCIPGYSIFILNLHFMLHKIMAYV